MAPSTVPTRHSFTLRAHLSETSRARELVLPLVVEAGFPEERCFDIQVACSEACANAIEHSPLESEVELAVLVYADRLEIQVEGRGQFQLPAAASRERVHRGLGLPLMAKLSDHLALYSGPRGGTLVALTFYRPGFRDEHRDDLTPPTVVDLLAENEVVSAILDSITDEVWFADSEKRFTLANTAALAEFGIPASGTVPVEQLAEDSEVYRADMSPRPMEEAPPLRALAGETVREQEEVVRTPATGEFRYRLVNAAPVRDASGRIIGAVSTVRDITERKRADEALRESQERYRGLFESIDDAHALCAALCDPSGHLDDYEFLEVNPAFERFVGLPKAQIVGRSARTLLGRHTDYAFEKFAEVVSTGEPARFENHSVALDKWFEVLAYCTGPGRFAYLARDVTERERAEEAVRESEARFRLALKNAPVTVAIQDRDLRFVWAYNQQPARPEDVVGKTDDDVFIPEDAARLIALKRRVLETAENVNEQIWLTRGGKPIFLDLYLEPIRDETGEVVGVGIATVDLTARKRAEEEREEQRRLLATTQKDYDLLFNGMLDGWAFHEMILDDGGEPCDYRFLGVNPAFERLTGLTGADIVGKTVLEVIPDLERSWIDTYGRVALTGQEVHFESYAAALGRHYEVTAYRPEDGRFATIFHDITERKQAEESLREREQTLRLAEQASRAGSWDWDIVRERITWDPELFAVFGLEPAAEEASFDTWRRILHPEDLSAAEARIEAALAEHSTLASEYRIILPDEAVRWIYSSGEGIYDENGIPVRMIGICVDVTARKEAEEALRQSEERFSLVFEKGAFPMAVSRDGVLIDVNEEWVKTLGYTKAEALGKTTAELGINHDLEGREAIRRELLERGSVRGLELPLFTRSGERRTVLNNLDILNVNGEEFFLSTIHDITERKQAEQERERLLAHEQRLAEELAVMNEELQLQTEELAAREEELHAQNEELRSSQYNRSLIEAALDPLVTIGPDGTITDVNQATIEITGYAREELLGTDFSDYFTEPEMARDGYLRAFRTGSVTDYPLTIRSRSGALTDVLYNASVFKDRGGNPIGVFAAARDLSAVKELKQQRDIAATLQGALLNIPQELPGLGLGHLYRSATSTAVVGGDFYDVFKVKRDRIGLLIGDVSGHGVEAARIATLVKDVIHAFAHQFSRPSVILRKTNDLLIEKGIPGFVTVFLGILDSDTGLLTYCSAGHPNPLRRGSGGDVELLESVSAPIGVFPGHSWRDAEMSLRKKDVLVLYTDGATEARRNGEFFGQERLVEALKRWTGDSPDLLPPALLEEVLSFSGGQLRDDVALLALAVTEDFGEKRSA